MRKMLMLIFIFALILVGCSDNGMQQSKFEDTAETEKSEKVEIEVGPEIDNTKNDCNISYEVISKVLYDVFNKIGIDEQPTKVAITSLHLKNDVYHIRLEINVCNKLLEASGTAYKNEDDFSFELWDLKLENEEGHYYWLSEDNTVLEDNSIRRNEDPYALYDFKSETTIKRRADLPKGNLANIDEGEFIEIVQAALYDIGYDDQLKEIEIESRESEDTIFVEMYFNVYGKNIVAELTKYKNYDWKLDRIDLYENPDLYYWVPPNTRETFFPIHDIISDKEIEIEDIDYDNYNRCLEERNVNESSNIIDNDFIYIEPYYTYSGNGDDVISGVETDNFSYAHIVHDREGYFSVKGYYEDTYDLLVSTTDPYDGNTVIRPQEEYTFEVSGEGDWSIEIYNIGLSSTDSFSGFGDYVSPMFTCTSNTYEITTSGEGYFSISGWTDYGRDLLVSTTDEDYSGKVLFRNEDGIAFFEIKGNREWEIKPVK